MAELKRNFAQGKMNKDADERIIPSGEYREATNVQVTTSDDSDVGSVQTLLGNVKHDTMDASSGVYNIPDTATCVGSLSVPNRDKIYYFVSAGDHNNATTYADIRKDYIVEYDTKTETHKYVFVDIYDVKTTNNAEVSDTNVFNVDIGAGVNTNQTGIRIGMHYVCDTHNISIADNITVTSIRYNADKWEVTLSDNVSITSATTEIHFKSEKRVLNFDKDRIINAISNVDEFLFFTDNFSEPKKINITRSILGTGGTEYLIGGGVDGFASANVNNTSNTFIGDTDYFHTRLVRTSQYSLENFEVVTRSDKKRAIYVDESHITVIRKAPTQPLTLDMSKESNARVQEDGTVNNSASASCTLDFGATADVGDVFTNVSFSAASYEQSNTDFRVGDVLMFIPQTGSTSQFTTEGELARGMVVASTVTGPNILDWQGFSIELLSFQDSIINHTEWWVILENKDPLFEHVLPRFSYRYKYQDGEYSTFAPFSQVAFLPGVFSYEHKEGYNLGMSNQVRTLKLKGFHPEEVDFPQDVVEIDILYKETNNPSVYTVATVKYLDNSPDWPDFANEPTRRGEYVVTTDMIHAIVPSNQLIRGNSDAVPRKALAQEISANRLIYGNYLQGFNVQSDPKIIMGLDSDYVSTVTGAYAAPSVKTMRSYQIGIVYCDEYGRTTPVLTSTESSINIPKINCSKRNRLKLKLDESASIPSWAKYFSYYIKETSNEYYTLVMDRWYEAEDGHIWISFPSSERNKVEEGTFITLKGKHGIDSPVTETNRYKILAIDNEAPEFITREDSVIGSLTLTSDLVGTSGPALGDPDLDTLAGSSEIIMTGATYGEAFAAEVESIIDQEKARNIFIRFTGQTGEMSETYEVVTISKVYEGDGLRKIKIKGSFGSDCDFVGVENGGFVTLNGDVLTMIKRENVLRPEFKGKFFAKIYKDSSLLNNVIYPGNSSSFTNVLRSYDLGYLNNNGYINAGTPATLLDSVDGSPLVGMYPRYLNPLTNYHEGAAATARLDKHPTENDWSGLADYSANDHDAGGAFYWGGGTTSAINQSNADLLTGVDVAKHPVKALNGFGQDYEAFGRAKAFWDDMKIKCRSAFFIDACTAYSWTSKNTNFPGNQYDIDYYSSFQPTDLTAGSGTGSDYGFRNFWDTHVSGDTPEYEANFSAGGFYGSVQDWYIGGGLGEAGDLPSLAGPGPNTSADQAGAFETNKGQPSRGIWSYEPGSSVIDIMHSGAQFGWDGSHNQGYNLDDIWDVLDDNGFAGGIPQRLDQQPIYADKFSFIEQLVQPNTKFRFARDPDATVYTVLSFTPVQEVGYANTDIWFSNTGEEYGAWGIRNLFTRDDHWQYHSRNTRQRWSIRVTPKIGSVGYGYNPITGVSTTNSFNGNNFSVGDDNFRRALRHDGVLDDLDNHGTEQIQILGESSETSAGLATPHPGIWETEPVESVDLDLYFQASGWIPIDFNDQTKENLLPIGSTFKLPHATDGSSTHTVTEWTGPNTIKFTPTGTTDNSLVQNESIEFTKRDYYSLQLNYINPSLAQDSTSSTTINADTIQLYGAESTVPPQYNHIHQFHCIDFFNCWSFGNGLESDRIRDDFNAPQMDNGVFASSVTANPKIKEERRKYGLIWSGIYNSINGINNTNQFLIGEKITKDINPSNGSIQALHTRDTRLIMFCEDKILRAVTNRDALYNADGNPQLVASNAVVGDVQAYEGEYGIAKNPESLVATPYRIYFTDAVRRHVLSLSSEGLRSISNLGMKDYFNDLFDAQVVSVRGTYDELKNEYNLSVIKKEVKELPTSTGTTVSFSERANGWVSFKSFIPQEGASINSNYYTFYNGHIWKHHDESTVTYSGNVASNTTINLNNVSGINVGMVVTGNGVIDNTLVASISNGIVTCTPGDGGTTCFTHPHVNNSPDTSFTFTTPRNNFYGTQYTSDITMIFNDQPNVVKSFSAMNYEGTEARVDQNTQSAQNVFNNDYSTNDGIASSSLGDGEYYNIEPNQTGWYVDTFSTNLQSCDDVFFVNKEDKYFGYPVGDTTNLSNLDEREFSVQGIGQASGITHENPSFVLPLTITVANNLSTSYQGDDESGDVWDVTPD